MNNLIVPKLLKRQSIDVVSVINALNHALNIYAAQIVDKSNH